MLKRLFLLILKVIYVKIQLVKTLYIIAFEVAKWKYFIKIC